MSFSLCKPLEPALQIRTTKAFLGLPITSKSLYLMGLCRKLFQLQTTEISALLNKCGPKQTLGKRTVFNIVQEWGENRVLIASKVEIRLILVK